METTEKKSCANCPSRLTAVQTVRFFGKTIGADMCAQFGTVLSRPGLNRKALDGLQERIARDCNSYGQPAPTLVAHTKAFVPKVAEPSDAYPPSIQGDGTPGDIRVRACTQCKWFLTQEKVGEKFGWQSGLCQAKGQLVMPHLTAETARGCQLSTLGSPSDLHVDLIDFYTPDYYHVDIFKSYGAGVDHPLTYVTDVPVSEEDTAEGIMAWRRIEDPKSSKFVMLPIYEPSQFNEADKGKIPQPGDDEHPELYLDYGNNVYKVAVLWRALDETPMAFGPAGVGKTELARHMAYLMQLPFERFSITESTEVDDLIGYTRYTPEKGTFFQRGRLPLAWERKCVMLIDEPNTGQPAVWQALRPLTDNSKQLVLDSSSGERVERSSHTYLMMAANPAWDPRNVGANQIGDADSSRLMHIRFSLPPELLEKKIIAARVALDNDSYKPPLDQIMAVARELRALSEQGTLPISWGIRVQIKVARAMAWFSPVQAYKLATDDLEPSVQSTVLDSVKGHFADDRDEDDDDDVRKLDY